MSFGPHLLLEAYGCDPEKLNSLELGFQILTDIPEMCGMTAITQPQVFRYSGKVSEDWGITGFVVIAESHISFHTFPEKGFMAFDVFSCREIELDVIIQLIKQTFNPKDVDYRVIIRGVGFPRSEV